MGKESLHRRSFHSDRDLKSIENMLELEKALLGKKANVDKSRVSATNGFEAPRNSLDVPAVGLMEMRRHSEVRYNDIPIGYELSRSLTSRRRNDEFSGRKSMSSIEAILSKPKIFDKGNMNTDQMSRTPSVVARLMGLDPLPHQRDSLQCPSELFSKKLQAHEFFMSEREPSITKQRSVSRASSQRGIISLEENLPSIRPAMRSSKAAVPFRDHPKEKQCQEFKKDLESTLTMSSKVDTHTEQGIQGKEGSINDSLQESQEFFEALDFLHSNKEFFVKVLKDPSSLFAKHLQERRGGGSSKQGLGLLKGSKLNRSLSESESEDSKQVSGLGMSNFSPMRGPYISLPLHNEATGSGKVHRATNHFESLDNEPLAACISHFGQDEHMSQCRPRPSSLLNPGIDQRVPTKIVVLRPKLGRHTLTMPSNSASDMCDATNVFIPRLEGQEAIPKNDFKERLKCEPLAAASNRPTDRLNNARDIARPIIELVKEDMSKRIFIEKEFTTLAKGTGRGIRKATQSGGAYGDTSCASDSEGYCSSSRRMARDNARANVSLPSSPRISRTDQGVHSKHSGDKGGRGVYAERKLGRVPSPSNTCRDAGRDNVGLGHARAIPNAKQDNVRDSKSQSSTRRGRKMVSSKDGREPLKVLQKSLAAPSVEPRNLEQKDSMHAIRLPMACSNTSRPAEGSLFKKRLLGLKDSLSMSKKKSSKKSSTRHYELVSSNQSADVSGSRESCSTMSYVYPWRAPSSSQAQNDKPAVDGCLDDGVSVNHKEIDVLHRWPLAGDLLESASDVSLEKCEQPSPVSVLVPPFDEESPSPEQPVSVCNERFSPLELDYKKQLLELHGTLLSSSSTSRQSSFNSVLEDTLCYSKDVKNPLETLSMCCIACASGAEDELVYIRDLLVFSGFTDNEYIEVGAFSREHGFSSSMFDKMENYYASMKDTNGHTPLDSSSRRILFDVVDEIFSWKFGRPTLQWGPIKQENLGLHVACKGKDVLQQIWAHIWDHRYVPYEYTEVDSLDALALKDLMKDATWMHSQGCMEAVSLELEKLVCGDLIREVTHELKLKLMST